MKKPSHQQTTSDSWKSSLKMIKGVLIFTANHDSPKNQSIITLCPKLMTLLKLRLKKLRGLSLIIYLWMTKTAQNVEPVYDKCQCQTMLHFRSDTPNAYCHLLIVGCPVEAKLVVVGAGGWSSGLNQYKAHDSVRIFKSKANVDQMVPESSDIAVTGKMNWRAHACYVCLFFN